MHRQTIRTFFEVRDGVVRVLHTDTMLTCKAKDHAKVVEKERRLADGISEAVHAVTGTV